ncbi:UNVERIFIED_CONTAM: hypothetical protein HDU68_002933 [Siphonaria sp. JEL0065]|nr:hypothetical protein HDU68_002933 [Siphonaria sp. JEL0065]
MTPHGKQQTTLYSLPAEVHRLIVLHTPLSQVHQLSLLSNHIFRTPLLHDPGFAMLHLTTQFNQTTETSIFSFLWEQGFTSPAASNQLPITYKTAILNKLILDQTVSFTKKSDVHWKTVTFSGAQALGAVESILERDSTLAVRSRIACWAAIFGHVDVMRRVLEMCSSPICMTISFETAMRNSQPDVISTLLEYNHVVMTESVARDLVSWSSSYGHAHIFSQLLADSRMVFTRSAIQNVLAYGHLDILDLCMKDARIWTRENAQFALARFVMKGDMEGLELILRDDGLDPSYSDNRPLQTSLRRKNPSISKWLLSHPRLSIDPQSAEDKNLISYAISSGEPENVKLLLEDPRIDVETCGSTAFVCACKEGMTAVVSLMLQDGRINPARYNNAALLAAVEHGHLEAVRLLAADGRVDVAVDGNLPLQEAFFSSRQDIVQVLLDTGRVDSSVIRPNSQMY